MRIQAIVAVATLAVASPAMSQDFLESLARGAARSGVRAITDRATQAVTQPRPPAAPARPAATAGDARTVEAAPAVRASGPLPIPTPINLSPSLRSPGEFEFSQADRDAKTAFVEFGKVSCNDCEGGFSFDTWAQHQIPGMFGKLGDHLWGLSVGESLRWTGSGGGGAYAITVTGEEPLNGFACKQLHYTGQRGAQSAAYRGVMCRGGQNGSVLF